MDKLLFKILFVILLILTGSSARSQLIYTCAPDAWNSNPGGDFSDTNKPHIPVSGTAKALVIYCKFSDDNFDLPPLTDPWPSNMNTLPSWTYSTISHNIQPDYPHPGISGYFDEMSMGKLQFIGDVCPVLIIPSNASAFYTRANQSNLSYLSNEILDKADPYVNYFDYDVYDPYDLNANNNFNEPDGIADMIIICFRFIPAGIENMDVLGGYNGIASLTGSFNRFPGNQRELVKDGVRIRAGVLGSGTFQHAIFDLHGQLHIMAHEIGHYMFNGTIYHLPGTGYYTLMSGIGCGIMSAFEREELAWVSAEEVNHDITGVELTDVIKTGKVFKIPVPNPPHNYPLHLYIENYNAKSYYQNNWLTVNGGRATVAGKGILITEANSVVYLSEIECADGKWQWERFLQTWYEPFVITDWNYKYPFRRLQPAFYDGENEMDLIQRRIDIFDPRIKRDHADALGDADDFFRMGYNEVYSPWSNPDISPYTSAHITVELTGATADAVYCNFYVNENTLLGSKPSKPQLWKIEIAETSRRPKITWRSGSEPDLAGYWLYRKIGFAGSWVKIAVLDKYAYQYTDTESISDTAYYKIQSYDMTNKFSVYSDELSTASLFGGAIGTQKNLPLNYTLYQNFPNPFNPVTRIKFDVPTPSPLEGGLRGVSPEGRGVLVRLIVYDVLGREIAVLVNEQLLPGRYEKTFDGSAYSSGIYFYKLVSGEFSESRKMLMVK